MKVLIKVETEFVLKIMNVIKLETYVNALINFVDRNCQHVLMLDLTELHATKKEMKEVLIDVMKVRIVQLKDIAHNMDIVKISSQKPHVLIMNQETVMNQ